MLMPARLCRPVLWLLLLSFAAGCAASARSNVGYLLEQDYQRMNNAQLTAYEQELSDAVARVTGSGAGNTSVGIGLGSWGHHGGFGLGVGQTLDGGGGAAIMELYERRDAVRGEMRRRGLLPAAAN
jgi:hypothetical protein